eukprot:TRINITY_DN147_c0_g1_i2.p1 TRINITY_DN147_c0_g1~~TRINITY_DN147_c0_g1_i2.p1  ORF type:complete len:186 (+),score=44.68 TRINITY_DN147_c0_g1_i2:659-1216(+)
MAADTHVMHSILNVSSDYDKIVELSQSKLLGTSGPVSDSVGFTDYIARNYELYRLRNDIELSNASTATWLRGALAQALRSRSPYNTNLLLGGVDDKGPALYYVDYLSSMHKMPFGAHGYAAYFVLGLLDRKYKPGMNEAEGVALLQNCIDELRTRFLVNTPNFQIKIVRKDGITKAPVAPLAVKA